MRRERGQTLILVALGLPVFFALLVLVIDGAQLLVERQRLQTAADAAALAAAQDLPPNAAPNCAGPDTTPGTCRYLIRASAEQYSSLNDGNAALEACTGPADRGCYRIVHSQGGVPVVEVRLAKTVTGFLGHYSWTLHASASASRDYRFAIDYQGENTVTSVVSSTVSLVN